MSAPTPAPGDDRPREGYYPDPSIPGYVRYWNGAAWVPGTSRPAPSEGEPLPAPPRAAAAPVVEETGPVFFDEEPEGVAQSEQAEPDETAAADTDTAAAQHGGRPEPASAWQADAGWQSGLGGEQDQRVSWGAPGRDPRLPAEGADPAPRVPAQAQPEAAAAEHAVKSGAGRPPTGEGTVTFRRPTGPVKPAGAGTPDADRPAEGTMSIRALRPQRGGGTGPASPAAPPSRTPAAPQPSAPPSEPSVPSQGGVPGGEGVVTAGSGGGAASWAQQVHQLAQTSGPAAAPQGQGTLRGEGPVVPWKPVAADPFAAVAQAQAAARPAGLGKRLAARLIDTVVLAAVTAGAALPLGTRAADHIDSKIDAAKRSGEKATVWLLDGTTAGYLGMVLGVLLLFGVLYEALPTAKWGRTLGKKLCGIEVRDIAEHGAPSFGAALRRWLVYAVPGVLVVGVVGVLWCVFDRPWRQCWHDKSAKTFVSG
ncbi:RDD family protein [Streptomyces sp. PmtG]